MRAAIDLATVAKARVTLLTCTTPALAAATADIRGTYMDVAETTARSRLQAGEHYAESRRTRVDSEHSFTRHPYQAINACAEALACDLIVMASHGKRGPIAMLLGSETLKVLTNAKVPVLVWR
jgi:nucleotide-binding universal stress UspA family protein